MPFTYGYRGPPTQRELAAYGSWFSSAVKSVGNAIGKTAASLDPTGKGGLLNTAKGIGTLIAAPLVMPTAIAVRATTWTLGKTGVKPLVAIDTATRQIAQSPTGQAISNAYVSQVAVGAVIGAGILAAPALGITGAGVGGALTAAGTDLAKKNLLGLVTPKPVAQPAPMPVAAPPGTAPSAGGSGVATALAGGGGGFLVAGPPGAAIGAAIGYLLGRK